MRSDIDVFLHSLHRAEGQTAVVTGATGGLGLEVARGLAFLGAYVILAGRNPEKGEAALRALRQDLPAARVSFLRFDLAALDSVAEAAGTLAALVPALDILVNNAGVMAPPARMATKDGFELQFGTNHLGHFALTGRLLPLLRQGRGVVATVSSVAAWRGTMPFDDLNAERHYSVRRYAQSKLAILSFSIELDRRSRLHGDAIHARAAHPGWAASNILANSTAFRQHGGLGSRLFGEAILRCGGVAFRALGQDVRHGAEPILYAILSPDALDGGYYGPQGPGERRGTPGPAPIPAKANDPALARDLWDASERLTGVTFAWGDSR
jgi:NAD(P)-dependent dehydrogenase (short-subunit alcohol dehydrogenase family)